MASTKKTEKQAMHRKALSVAVLLVVGSAVPATAAQSLAQDRATGADQLAGAELQGNTDTDQQSAATEAVAMSEQQSGSFKPPVPDTGTTAMLIAGLGMIGFAARRRSVAV